MAGFRRRTVLALLSAFSFVTLLRGCGDNCNYTTEQAEQYLEERYGGDFSLSEAVIETNTTATTGTDQTHISYDPKHYYFHDENDIPCTFDMDVNYGCTNSYYVTEDYQVRWLRQNSDLYRSLTDDKSVDCVFSDDPGKGYTGLFIKISRFEDAEPVCRKVFSVLRSDGMILPDKGVSTDWNVNCIRPGVVFVNADGETLWDINFRTMEKDRLTDEDVVLYRLQYTFAEQMKKSGMVPAVEYMDIFSDGTKLTAVLNSDNRYFQTTDKVNSRGRLKLEQMEEICRAAGLKVRKWNRNKVVVVNGDEKVEIIRSRNYMTKDIFTIEILKNGEPFVPEGGEDTLRVNEDGEDLIFPAYSLTTSDYTELFGIEFDYDFEEGKAEIR